LPVVARLKYGDYVELVDMREPIIGRGLYDFVIRGTMFRLKSTESPPTAKKD
jgi:hypothetical protein